VWVLNLPRTNACETACIRSQTSDSKNLFATTNAFNAARVTAACCDGLIGGRQANPAPVQAGGALIGTEHSHRRDDVMLSICFIAN
jgi:hypothetical protein